MYDLVRELRSTAKRCNGNQQDVAALLDDAADRIDKLNLAIDDLGKMLGSNSPAESRDSIRLLLRQHTAFKCTLQSISDGQLSADQCKLVSESALSTN